MKMFTLTEEPAVLYLKTKILDFKYSIFVGKLLYTLTFTQTLDLSFRLEI